ncbi:MAG: biotin/lipoate--protein ligase family protein [Xanthobacteraceae bacterium]
MAGIAKGQAHTPFGRSLDLPPPFRALALREVGDAFAHATMIAPDSGAGTLVHVDRYDLAEFAVVLEPEEPLSTARRALYAGLTALAEALAVHAPPEKPINFAWPDAILIDGGLVGGARLAWPAGSDEDVPPAWLVFGAMIRTAAIDEQEPGLHPLAAALDAEGFDLGSHHLLESFARHLMVVINAWQEIGFSEVARSYLSRLAPKKGVRPDIADNGDLLMCDTDGIAIERRPLLTVLAMPSWLDLSTGGPRL